MINLLKNKEIRKAILLQLIAAGFASCISFLYNKKSGIITSLLSLFLILVYYISTYKRYKKIKQLAENVNKILHGDNSISIENYCEGDLAILHSEIYKMTIRLREQQQKLINDKIYLADSLADISHQIRTPLTSINLIIQLLSKQNLSNKRRQELTHELYELISRIEWLITTLLKISKLDAGTVQFKKENISMQSLINNACSALLIPIELRAQELSLKISGNFYGDVSWTSEAIGNIIKNCMEHTPENGKIEITTSDNVLYSQIIICDNGTGIAKEDLPHIFERFYKGKDSSDKSFGIGLALSRMIITSQKGTIKAENRHPSGSVFTIRFYKGTV